MTSIGSYPMDGFARHTHRIMRLQQRNHNLRILLVCVVMFSFHNAIFTVYYIISPILLPLTTSPITSAYSDLPYVAMMFRNIRRLGVMKKVGELRVGEWGSEFGEWETWGPGTLQDALQEISQLNCLFCQRFESSVAATKAC